MLVVPSALQGAVAATTWSYRFDPAATGAGIPVTPAMLFSAERGFGFEPGAEIIAQPTHVTSREPFLFSVAVPEGNYLVSVMLGDPMGESSTTIKAESRRLMLEDITTMAGKLDTRTFAVNVRNAQVPAPPLNAPGGDHVELNSRELNSGPHGGVVLHWDDKLTLEFNGPQPALVALTITRNDALPTIFLAGDSTVTDQPREPGASWGQMLTRFLRPTVAVANHAESGETLKSFLTELRLDKLLSQMKRGDYLFLQFGHNDSKSNWPQTYVEPATTYQAYLRVFIAEARRRGAIPVLVTSVQRRQFDTGGRIRNSHGDFPDAVRTLAREEKVALIDLERASVLLYEALGPEKSPLAFSAGGRDVTHHNNYGAYQLAKAVAQGIRDAGLGLATHLVDDFGGFDPGRPDPVDQFNLAASAGTTTQAPRGN